MSNSDQNRKYGSYLFIAVLAVLFALQWGPGSQGCDTRIMDEEVAATVNGKPIPLKDFRREYANRSDTFRRQGLPPEFLKQFQLDKQTLDALINTELLKQAAEQRGLQTSDDELLKVLGEMFKKDGKFDAELYKNYVRNREGLTEVAFEERVRRELAAQKLLELVESSVSVSEDEVKSRYLKEGDSANLTFVRFSPSMYAAKVASPKQSDIDAWAKSNEAAIATFYEQNKFSYFEQEKVRARQIVLKTAPDADAATKAEIKQRIENVRKQLVDEKKDFAELAKAVSEDPTSREKGGDLGLVDRLQLPSAFADVLFALKEGEISAPVETPAGWFVGTVSEKVAPKQRPIEEVRGEIAKQLFVKEKALALAKVDAEKALTEVKAGKKLKDLYPADTSSDSFAAAQKPQAKETGTFSRAVELIPQVGGDATVKKTVFDRKSTGVMELVTVDDAVLVVDVTERTLPSDEAFEKDKAELTAEAVRAKRLEVRDSFLKGLKQGATVTNNDQAISKAISEG